MLTLLQVMIEYGVMALNSPFTYAYSGPVKLVKGLRVQVPFGKGSHLSIGFIVEDPKEVEGTLDEYNLKNKIKIKEISRLIDERPIINGELLELAKKASDYYLCPFIEMLKTMLPPSLRPDSVFLTKPKLAQEYYFLTEKEYDENELDNYEKKVLLRFKENPQGLLKSSISSKITLTKLINKGLVEARSAVKERKVEIEGASAADHDLNSEQEKAYETIISSADRKFLLQGVTGSGKTEVYIKLIQHYLSQNQGCLVLVPEISLTDRMISLFKTLFGDQVALLHSGLSDGQKYSEYLRIASGEAKVVVGARSAVFAPVACLGLIILDEEHVESYKQDVMPFYDARKIALFRLEKHPERKLVFGSATPSIDARARAEKGLYKLLKLEQRYNGVLLPQVSIVDLNDYANIDYESTLISLPLREAIKKTLSEGKQVIILLNRRGFAPFYLCRKCQKPLKCPNCDLPLTYHKKGSKLVCHHCDYEVSLSDLKCPKCGGEDFEYIGYGTQRTEEEIARLFPEAKTVLFDADTTRNKGSYHKIISDFAAHKYDIMVGTQLVAKGHDFPDVGLTAAINADQSLSFPSYKANEDTFDLLTQLSGRAGRKDVQGQAIIQTYSKDNEVISLAAKQDYEAFYKYEMVNRQQRTYPPYCYLVDISVSGTDLERVMQAAFKVKNYLVANLVSQNKRSSVYGPSEPFIPKKGNRYYRMLMVKYKDPALVHEDFKKLVEIMAVEGDIKVSLDVDPSSDI